MIVAIELMRVNFDALSLDELERLACHMESILLELHSYIQASVCMHMDEARNASRLKKKLHERLAYVRNLIRSNLEEREAQNFVQQTKGVNSISTFNHHSNM